MRSERSVAFDPGGGLRPLLRPSPPGAARVACAVLAVLAVLSGLLPAQSKVDPRNLAPQYREWLKLTTYIIRDKEREVFLGLTNDRDRDLFIDAFWKIRDPNPATPDNEYRQEIIKRFQDANKKFGRRSAREGWMTDQGRIYMILGPPKSTEDIAGSGELYPCEIWSYYGDVSKGMPTHFQLMFFQWRNAGEYKLYDPMTDGPAKLLIDSIHLDPSDYETIHAKIFDAQPDVAAVSLSIIPGEIPVGYHPSPETAILMANIIDSPKRGINDSYATHFLNYRGLVSTEYLTNFIECEASVAVVKDPLTGLDFIDFAVAPSRLSVDLYEPTGQYTAPFQIDVSLRSGEKVIYQYSKDFPVTIPNEESLADYENMGVCLADSFPAVAGSFRLTILLRNSAGKEFSVIEKDVRVPEEAAAPRLGRPMLGYKMADVPPGAHVPFQAETRKLNVDPKNTFSAGDSISCLFNVVGLSSELWKDGSIGVTVKGKRPEAAFQKTVTLPLNGQTFRRNSLYSLTLAGLEFPPDYYDVSLALKDGAGMTLDEQTANFILSPKKGLAHPVIASKATSLANSFIFYFGLGRQYGALEMNDKAETMYRTAASMNPAYLQLVPDYAELLLKMGKPGDALTLLERIKDDGKLKFQHLFLQGRALMGQERFPEAARVLEEGNRIYNSDTLLLNALGACYDRLGRTAEALTVLRASLKLNPGQAEIRKLVAEIESRKR